MKKKIKTFDEYKTELKIANIYQNEMNKIRKENEFDKKEKYIKKTKSFVQEKDFQKYLLFELNRFSKLCSNVSLLDDFIFILEKYNGETDEFSKSFDFVKLENDEIIFYTTYSIGFIEEESIIVSFPIDFDVYSLLKDLEKLETKCIKIQIERNKEQELLKEKEKQQREKEEYELYLKLKEKYDK